MCLFGALCTCAASSWQGEVCACDVVRQLRQLGQLLQLAVQTFLQVKEEQMSSQASPNNAVAVQHLVHDWAAVHAEHAMRTQLRTAALMQSMPLDKTSSHQCICS
jgi:hypothetical protein